ncbi:MAG: HD domain-containing protein [Gammaproteobacteria bacterium]|nr:HD domain-containing protein [Gammaproteobacteria bacterium]
MDKTNGQTLAGARGSSVTLRVVDGGLSTPQKTSSIHSAELTVVPRTGGCSEISRAIDRVNALSTTVKDIHRIVRGGKLPELNHARYVIDAIIDDFTDELDALFWALTANGRMYHLCRRSVGCVIWALAMGRALQLDRKSLHELMLGALLLDIGKLRVPVVILVKAGGLSDTEHRFARRHVSEGVRIVEAINHRHPGELSAEIVEMVRSHHERVDGSGYPCRLQRDEISLYAQIAAIIDSYDALSVSRYYADGVSGDAALVTLRRQHEKFDPDLLELFCNAIGDYPTGTWVEFSDGSTGVVCGQDADEGTARVALIADEQQQPFLEVRWLSLHQHNAVRVLPPAERPAHAGAMERSLQSAIYAFRPRRF